MKNRLQTNCGVLIGQGSKTANCSAINLLLRMLKRHSASAREVFPFVCVKMMMVCMDKVLVDVLVFVDMVRLFG